MADNQTTRLLLQVDAAVALASSNLRALANTVEGESKNYDKSVARMEGAHKRLDQATGSSRIAMMEMQHVFRSFGDSVAAGQDPMRAFIMELGRVGQAAELVGQNGAMGAFGKFIGGPWGMALSLGIATLASLAGGHEEASKAANKHATTADLLRRALKGDEEAYKALKEAIDAEYKAANEAIRTSEQSARAAYNEANAQRVAALAIREKAKAELDAALAAEKAALARLKAPEYGAHDERTLGAQADYTFQQSRVAKLEVQVRDADTELQKAQRATLARAIPIVEERVKRDTDPSAAARGRYDDGIGRLRQQFAAGTISADKLQQAEDKLTRTRDAELKAIEEANKKPRDTSRRDAADATNVAYVKQWLEHTLPGVQVTSTTNHSKYVAGTKRISDHYMGRAIDFVPPGGMGSMTKADVRAMFEEAGLRIRRNASGVEQLFGPGDKGHSNHFHVGYEGSAPTTSTLEKREEAKREKAARDEEAFQQLKLRAEEQLLAATKSRAMSAEEQAGIEIAQVYAERSRQQSAVEAMVTEKKMSQAQADELMDTYRRIASAKVRGIQQRATQQTVQDQLAIERGDLRTAEELERIRGDMATTTKARRDSAIRQLDLAIQQERQDLEALVASKEATETQKEIARHRLASLPDVRSARLAQIDRANADPLTAYMQQLRANTGDMNEALKGVEVDGLKSLEDGILGVINGTETLAGAFKKMASSIIADLARIAIEKGILSLISTLSGGSGGGGFGDLGAFKGVQDSSGLAFAAGGSPPVGLASLVGEKGPELFVPKVPGVIIPNHMLGGKGGGGVAFNIQIDAKGAEIGVEQKIAAALVQVAPQFIAAAHRHTMGSLSRRGING